jgi:hypothetical protein
MGGDETRGVETDPPRVRRWRATSSLLFLLLCGAIAWSAHQLHPPLPFPGQPLRVRSVRRSASGDKLWQARWYRARAIDAVNRARYDLLENPAAAATRPADREEWRRRLMAQDRTGDLRKALITVREAQRLARGRQEEYLAREWWALIACDAGLHREELAQAKRMVVLEPRNIVSLTSLRRAARCNHQWALARQADAQLRPLLYGMERARRAAPYGFPSIDGE